MKRMLISLSALILVGLFIAPSVFAQQNNVDPNKVWSKIEVDETTRFNFDPNYKYIEAPQVTRVFRLEETDVAVGPNYRPHPTTNTTQSELSIDVHPLNASIVFASSNATPWPVSGIYGTGVYWTLDGGLNWTGFDNPPFGSNSGDPASVITPNGNWYEGYISNPGGQGVAVTTDNGSTWNTYTVAPNPGSLADKNHLYGDKMVGSPYVDQVYAAWTDFGGSNDSEIIFKYSTNFGVTWSSPIDISSNLNAGSHNQGVNINTGPNGEVYCTWAIYDAWPGGEDAIAFGVSTDGGATWTSSRVYEATNFGVRGTIKPTGIRVSSFPSMSVDRSGGVNHGNIYITWTQRSVAPAGNDPDIVSMRSTDGGLTWEAPLRVNDDAMNNGKDQYYPWVNVDQSNGQVNYIWYDSRDMSNDSAGVYMARSIDGGLTFENFQVSDANFKPKPIPGLAGGYQGDYIGIASLDNKAFPYWADDRTGNYQGWTAEVTFGPAITHDPLENTENLIGPYNVVAQIVSTNPINPASVYLHWGRGTGVISDSVLMINTTGDTYTASIPGNGSPAIYNYYIYAEDNTGAVGTAPGGAPLNYYTFEALIDAEPPTIVHTPLDDQPQIRWPVEVEANVTDNIGLQSVEVEYKINGGTTSTFALTNTGGSRYAADFPNVTVNIGDIIDYRIVATDNSNANNVAMDPSTGFHQFNIIDVRGLVLVVDDDVTLENRASEDKGGEGDLVTPLGVSADRFINTLNAEGYSVDQTTFGSLDINTLDNYDVVILAAGLNESTMFDDQAKRTAITNYTLNDGKTLVEGGEVGYQYRKSGTTTDRDPEFRRNVLNDSAWVSDQTGDDLVIVEPNHRIFNHPNVITGPIGVNNGGGFGWGARDEVTLLPKVGVMRVSNWTTTTNQANGSIIIHYPDGDTSVVRNIFFAFSVSQIADENVASDLIYNAVELLMRDLIIPVELSSFTASVSEDDVSLSWTTATELNNQGFDIERRSSGSEFTKIGFVPGYGTTTEIRNYSFTDADVSTGNYTYRLKQIDLDGTTSYSDEVNVDVSAPLVFALEQNYPNPFNPSTLIKYAIPQDAQVNLVVYNLLGEEVATLVNQVQRAGRYEVNFDARSLASGIYFYSIEAGDFYSVKKMMLMK